MSERSQFLSDVTRTIGRLSLKYIREQHPTPLHSLPAAETFSLQGRKLLRLRQQQESKMHVIQGVRQSNYQGVAEGAPSFSEALRFILKWEGGISLDSADRGNRGGNATVFGITQRTFDAYLKSRTQPVRSVLTITKQEAYDLYEVEYWSKIQGDRLPLQVATALFDSAVNHGVSGATRMLQRVVGVNTDGIVGEKTLSAVKRMDPKRIVEGLIRERVALYQRLVEKDATQEKFLRGWMNRVAELNTMVKRH